MAKEDLSLNEKDRQKLDDIVSKMIANKESDKDIQFVVDDFKSKYGLKKKELTQSDLAAGESLSPSTEDKLSPLQKAVKAGAEILKNEEANKPEPIVKPKTFLEEISAGFAKERPVMGTESTFVEPKVLGKVGEKPVVQPVSEEKIPVGAKKEHLAPLITDQNRTEYLWKQVKDDVAKSDATTTSEFFNKNSDVYAQQHLDDDQKNEYNFIKNIQDANSKIDEFNKILKNGPNELAQFGLAKAEALKATQEAAYAKYKEDKYRKIDSEIADYQKIVNSNVEPDVKDYYNLKIRELKSQKENFFLDENALIEKKYSENKEDIKKFEIPGLTAKEKLRNYYLTLDKERSNIYEQMNPNWKEQNSLENTISAIGSAISSFTGADKGLAKRFAEVDSKMKSLAPIVLINRSPLKDIDEGFFESTLKSARKVLLPIGSEFQITTPVDLSNKVKESLAISAIPENTLSKITGQNVTESAKGPESLNAEWFGNIIGTSIGMMPYFTQGVKGVKAIGALGDLPVLAKYLKGTKFGKYLISKPVITGLGYKAAGYLMPATSPVKDEATFLSGFFGGIAQAGLDKFVNTSYIASLFNRLFGDDAERMAIMVSKVGDRVGQGLGEYAEEVGNTIGPMISSYMDGEEFGKIRKDFNDNFGTMSKNLELFVASFTMGAIMGAGTGYGQVATSRSKDFYSKLNSEDKKKADSFVNRITQERYNAMVAAKKAEIKSGKAVSEPVTERDLKDKEDAINVLTDRTSSPQERQAALSVLADINLKIDANKIAQTAESELKAGDTSTEVKPEDELVITLPPMGITESTVAETATTEAVETKPLTNGTQVQMEPQIKGGMPRIMEFKDGTWFQKVGNELSAVSKEVQQEAQDLYDSQNKARVSGEVGVGQEPIQTKPIEGAGQEAPSTSGNVQTPQEVDEEKAGTIELKTMELANKNVEKFLQDSGIEVNVLNTQEEFDAAQKNEGLVAERGTEGVFIGKSGKIYINKSNLQKGWAKTILYHEATHPVINIIRNTNPEKYKSLVNGLNNLVKNGNKELKDELNDALKWAKKQYAGKPEGTIEDEFVVEVIARISSGRIKFGQIEPTLREKIVEFINQIAKAIGLPPITPKTDTETFKKTARQVADAMRRGKSISKVVGKENVGEYGFKSEAQKSAVKIMEGKEKMSKYGLKGDKAKTREVGEALEERQRQKYGTIDQNDRSPEAMKKISSWMVDEIEYFIEAMGENSGKGWYGEKYQKGLDMMAKIFPEMKSSKNARDLFTMLVAITSDGEKVLSNFRLAAVAYSEYVKSGRKSVPLKLPGMRQASFAANLSKINSLLKEYNGDIQKIKSKLLEVKSISEINKERKAQGQDKLKTSWPASFNAPLAASIFGPKLGMFYSNLSGKEDYPTLDRWWSRTFNRYRGNVVSQVKRGFNTKGEPIGIDRVKQLLGKPKMSDDSAMIAIIKNRDSYADKNYKNGTELEKASNTVYKAAFENLNDSPENSTDRLFMYDTVSNAVKKLNAKGYDLTIADAQAILWYFEKNLYKTLGVQAKIEGISYEEAANATVDKFKQNGSLDYKISAAEDESGIEEEDDIIDNTEAQASRGQREDLQKSEKQTTFAQDETRRTKEATPSEVSFAKRIGRPVGYDALQVGQRGVEERGFTKTDLNKSLRIGGRDVKVKTEFVVQPSVREGIKANIPNAYIDKALLEITGDPDSYHKFISTVKANHPQGAAVYVYPKQDYANMRLFITPDGEAGVAIKPNGDFVSAFNKHIKGEGRKPNRLAQLMILGVKAGAKKADAFDTVLPDYYSKFGFRVVAKVPFSWDAAPEAFEDEYGNSHKGWEKEDFIDFNQGEPDVTFLVYDGGDRATIQDRVGDFDKYSLYENSLPYSTYDEAVEIQNKALKGEAQMSTGGRDVMNVGGVQQRVKDLPEGLNIIDGFYSPIEKRILEFKQPKASATKWKEIVGAKSDEAVFSGMTEWLNTFKPDQQISKEEVQDFIKNNRVEIKQVIKADNWREFYDQRVAAMNKEYEYFKTKGIGRFDIQRTIPDAVFDKLNDADQDRLINLKAEQDFLGDVYFDYGNARQVLTGAKESEMPKYKKYVERGDFDDYKEILVTAPTETKALRANAEIDRRLNEIDEELNTVRTYKKVGDSGTVSDFELVVTDQKKFDKLVAERRSLLEEDKKVYKQIQDAKEAEYRSSHYNERNIIVHTRTDVRNDQNGDKLFFIEEVQSDWGQEGKKKGFAEKPDVFTSKDVKSIKQEGSLWLVDFGDKYDEVGIRVSNFPTEELAIAEAVKKLNDSQDTLRGNIGGEFKPSKAPYVTNTNAWVKLGLKIALQQAVQADAAKIAWTTGEQQNKRYDLSKQVDAITYEKNDDGTYNIHAGKDSRTVDHQDNVPEVQLESLLGKDIAQRIINGEGAVDDRAPQYKSLTGVQLSVGGKGMTGFYGNLETPGIMGNAIKALVKELTGKEPTIEASALGYTDDYEDEIISNKEEYDAAIKRAGVFLYKGEVLSKSEAFDYLERGMKIGATFPKVDLQPSIEITPELKAAVERGMAQFSKGERGVKPTFEEATDLFYKIKGTEGAAKKKALADERKALMDQNPSVKYIDDNIKSILDQLEKKEMATRKGNCP